VRRLTAGLLALLLSSCGSAEPRVEAPEIELWPESEGDQRPEPPVDPPQLSPRALLSMASFSKLVEIARRLDESDDTESGARCILRPRTSAGAGYRLEAEIAVAVRPLPDAPEDLDARLRASGEPIRPLTRWGLAGAALDGMLVASFTALPPVRGRAPIVLALTNEGHYLRRDSGGGAPAGPVSVDAVRAFLDGLAPETVVVFVTAEAGVPVRALERVLATIPPRLPVALAVALPADTTLPPGIGPAERPLGGGTEGLCPDGLPPGPGGRIEGELDPALIRQALAPLDEAGRECVAGSGAAVASGSVLDLAFRIAEDGTVAEACVTNDGPGSVALRRCLLEALRALSFPRPIPGGTVDVEAPLVVQHEIELPLCR